MKPANFPTARMARKLSAMERLPKDSEAWANTKANLVANPRDIKTKKQRTGMRRTRNELV